MLLDAFHDSIFLYTQDIHVVNFSDVPRGFSKCHYYVRECRGKVSEVRSSGRNR